MLTTKYSELLAIFDKIDEAGLDIMNECDEKWKKTEHTALVEAYLQVYDRNFQVTEIKTQTEIDKELSDITQKLENIRLFALYYGMKRNK